MSAAPLARGALETARGAVGGISCAPKPFGACCWGESDFSFSRCTYAAEGFLSDGGGVGTKVGAALGGRGGESEGARILAASDEGSAAVCGGGGGGDFVGVSTFVAGAP